MSNLYSHCLLLLLYINFHFHFRNNFRALVNFFNLVKKLSSIYVLCINEKQIIIFSISVFMFLIFRDFN